MSIERVQEDLDVFKATRTGESLKIQRRWYVRTSGSTVGPLAVEASTGLPSLGDTYSYGSESQTGLILSDLQINRVRGKPRLWTVDGTYDDSYGGSEGGSGDDASELTRARPEIRIVPRFEEKAVEKDVNGNRIENAAGDPFDPPLVDRVAWITIEITRYEMAFNDEVALTYMDTLNANELWGFGNGALKMASITGVQTTFKNILLWRTQYSIEFGRWRREVLNQGLHELRGENRHRIVDDDGLPVEVMVNLAADGTKLPAGAEPVFLEFDILPELDWTALGLPDSLN